MCIKILQISEFFNKFIEATILLQNLSVQLTNKLQQVRQWHKYIRRISNKTHNFNSEGGISTLKAFLFKWILIATNSLIK